MRAVLPNLPNSPCVRAWPLFYQIVTDELFDQLVKNKLAAADEDVDETDKYLEEP